MDRPAEISIGIVFKQRPPSGDKVETATGAAALHDARFSEALIERAVGALIRRGFRVTGRSASTLSIRGTPELFEHTFGTKLKYRPLIVPDSAEEQWVVELADDLVPVIPEDLRDVIAIVQIQPANLYQSTGAAAMSPTTAGPLATPPTVPGYYLDVLTVVPRLLKADKVHAKGAKGAGVRVAMIDSGFEHQHDFFVANGFASSVFLANPLSGYSAAIDARGHGTGESANLFAIAPLVDFVGIKLGGDRAGDPEASLVEGFQAALALRPSPRIISCSVMLTHKPWAALAQVIADADAQDVAVVVCSGNGNYAFPAQMREVIAAGGVFVTASGRKRASNFASAFVSTEPAYAGRSVPDCCGLVGELPRAAYIMLPVPSGSSYDQDRANPAAAGNPGDGTADNDGWALFSGTSAAAPQLAGICALLLEKNPSLKPAALKSILRSTCVPVSRGSTNPATGGVKATSTHPNTATGAGLVNAYAAWQAA
ncbi:MAG: S8 family serine peptidase [Caldimonas sp.]